MRDLSPALRDAWGHIWHALTRPCISLTLSWGADEEPTPIRPRLRVIRPRDGKGRYQKRPPPVEVVSD